MNERCFTESDQYAIGCSEVTRAQMFFIFYALIKRELKKDDDRGLQ